MPRNPDKPTREQKVEHLRIAMSYCKNFRLALDVGAHQGLWSEVMAEKFEQVECWEPWDHNQERWHLRMDQYKNAKLHHAAVANKPGFADLLGRNHSGHYIEMKSQGLGLIPVERIDDYNFKNVDLLKVDTEGADGLVLIGATDTIKRCHPVVIVEWKPKFDKRYPLPPKYQITYLEELGYKQVEHIHMDHIFTWA
jgi:FkbM family methyltransferase